MRYFHMGKVVDDIDDAVARYGQLGLRFARTRHVVTTYDVRGTLREVELLVTYSIQAPHLELIQEIRGDVWKSAEETLDHLGIWSDDVAADVERYGRAGFSTVLSTPAAVSPRPLVAYMVNADGLYVELLSTVMRRDAEKWLRTSHRPGDHFEHGQPSYHTTGGPA